MKKDRCTVVGKGTFFSHKFLDGRHFLNHLFIPEAYFSTRTQTMAVKLNVNAA